MEHPSYQSHAGCFSLDRLLTKAESARLGLFEGVALIVGPARQLPQFPGLVNTGIMSTVSLVWTNTTGAAVFGPG